MDIKKDGSNRILAPSFKWLIFQEFFIKLAILYGYSSEGKVSFLFYLRLIENRFVVLTFIKCFTKGLSILSPPGIALFYSKRKHFCRAYKLLHILILHEENINNFLRQKSTFYSLRRCSFL